VLRPRSIALVLLFVLLAGGCSGGESRREQVASYVESVNSIQLSLRQPLVELAQANREFSMDTSELRRVRPRLAKSEAAIRKLDNRLRELDPPPDARRLHELLLQLVAAEVTLTHELRQTAIYLPQLQEAVKPFSPASTRLRTGLRRAKDGIAQARALERYSTDLQQVTDAMRMLEPSTLLAAVHTSQLRTLERVQTAADALARALRRRDSAAVSKLARRFQQASLSGDSISAQKARIAGFAGYNARVKMLRTLAARVQRERDRLQRTLK
jgi:hypothetical protein